MELSQEVLNCLEICSVALENRMVYLKSENGEVISFSIVTTSDSDEHLRYSDGLLYVHDEAFANFLDCGLKLAEALMEVQSNLPDTIRQALAFIAAYNDMEVPQPAEVAAPVLSDDPGFLFEITGDLETDCNAAAQVLTDKVAEILGLKLEFDGAQVHDGMLYFLLKILEGDFTDVTQEQGQTIERIVKRTVDCFVPDRIFFSVAGIKAQTVEGELVSFVGISFRRPTLGEIMLAQIMANTMQTIALLGGK